MISCPLCKKKNASSPCRRCGADLSLLIRAHEGAMEHLDRAKVLVSRGDIKGAVSQVEASLRLKESEDAKIMKAALGYLA